MTGKSRKLSILLREIRACRICEEFLPLGPRPVLRAHQSARALIVGQAPGTKVHESGIPWNDPSGDRLRAWMQVDRETFYDESQFAIIPMGFCYPGRGTSGDLPPRPECAEAWRDKLHALLPNIELTILAGAYGQAYYLGQSGKPTLAHTVKNWKQFAPNFFPLPHPSPRNQIWMRKNPWFDKQVIPALRRRLRKLGIPATARG